jgi:hypothetical protein
MRSIEIGCFYWCILPFNCEDNGFDPVEPYAVEVDGRQVYDENAFACHVVNGGPYPPYVGARAEDLFETRAGADAAYRQAILELADELERRALDLRAEAARL